jgi:Na+/melibiose symporter-like transporter
MLPLLITIPFAAWWFIKRNRKQKHPLIDLALLRAVINPLVLFLFLGGFFTVYLFIISLFLQGNMGFSAAQAGLLLFPFSILSALTGKFFVPLLVKRFQTREIAILAMVCMTLGALLLFLCLQFNYLFVLLFCSIALVNGLGIAIGFTALTMMSVYRIPEDEHGLATSMTTTAYFFGGGLGLSVVSIFIQADTIGTVPIIVLALYGLGGLVWLLKR